ncbi:putative procollagen-proline 4-dioxygenase [Lupinus albus]|uniref:Putative procollagen-proline 4-dioxygenase n=1 Tax=Lupinus albus TaxID=3870 RepID=A0A6A4PUJ9_LUPAL|nr:putative procollagen-proline 4-dioxygenase [Lupinus albus]
MGSLHFLSLSLFFFILSVSSVRLPAFDDVNKTMHVPSVAFDPTRVTQLSWAPRAFLYKGFLSEKECDHLINKATRSKLEKSLVADDQPGKNVMTPARTSTGMFFSKAEDEIITEIEARIATWTFFPVENGEPIQMLHYEHGQKYEPHFDFFRDKYNLQFGGNRVATILMYLSNVGMGGETIFPIAEVSFV